MEIKKLKTVIRTLHTLLKPEEIPDFVNIIKDKMICLFIFLQQNKRQLRINITGINALLFFIYCQNQTFSESIDVKNYLQRPCKQSPFRATYLCLLIVAITFCFSFSLVRAEPIAANSASVSLNLQKTQNKQSTEIVGTLNTSFISPSAIDELEKNLNQIRLDFGISSIGFSMVDENGAIYANSIGLMNHQTDTKANADTIYRVGSITKSFTALAMLKALRSVEKNLTLNEKLQLPAQHWLSSELIQNPWHDNYPVQLGQLMEQTAGFHELSATEFNFQESDPISLEQALLKYKKFHRVAWRPGFYYSYTNLGAGYVGRIVEKVSGQNFDDYIFNNILKPLEMPSSSLLPPEDFNRLAQGYNSDGRTPIPYWHMLYRPFGALNASPKEMANFISLLLGKGTYKKKFLFEKQEIARMETPKTTIAAKKGLKYGYGLGNYQWIHNGFLFYGHGGDADGYLSRYGYSHELNRGYFYVITAFNHNANRKIRRHFENLLTKNLVAKAAPETFKLDSKTINKIEGAYERKNYRFGNNSKNPINLKIIYKNQELIAQFSNKKAKKLTPISEIFFHYPNENRATIFIGEAEDGEIYFQDENNSYLKIK